MAGNIIGFSGCPENCISFCAKTELNRAKIERDKLYDASFKKFFKRKSVLATILIDIVPEYKHLSFKEIEDLIIKNDINSLNAETFSEEDVSEGGKILYDIVVKCKMPNSEACKENHIIFDLEMQRSFRLQYNLLDRAMYYASRLLSRQKSNELGYEGLIPVYSTWICLYKIPKSLQNTVQSFRLMNTQGNDMSLFTNKSLVNIDFILLSGDDYDWDLNDPTCVKFLHSVQSNKLSDRRFNPNVDNTADVQKEVLSMMDIERDYKYHMDQERSEGREEGREEGSILSNINTINKMMDKGLALTDVISLVDCEESLIRRIYSLIEVQKPEYNPEIILSILLDEIK